MSAQRYSTVAVALHWSIAALILGQIAGGLYMHNLPNDADWKFPLYQLHKSFGLSILALTVVRLFWRAAHRPPALPADMPGWQKRAARTTHWAFYALMLLTPLAGWAMVSVSPLNVPTEWFGMIRAPHLPFGAGADASALEDIFKEAHEYLAFAILGLLALHVAAALKHSFIDRDGVMATMSPFRLGVIAIIFAVLAFLGAAAGIYLTDPSPPTAEELQSVSHDYDHDEGGHETAEPEAAPSSSGEEIVAPSPSVPASAAPADDHHGHDHEHDDADKAGGEGQSAAPAEAPAAPPVWRVDYEKSWLRFIGEERAARFEGAFSEFTADIKFDPENLAQSTIKVVVNTATGATGGEFRDAAMQDREWFDTRAYPTATFTSSAIRRVGEGAYEADGVLAIKDFEKSVTLGFTLTISGDAAAAKGGVDLVRTDFGLGLASSWLDDEEVGLNVRVEFEIAAETN